MFVHLQCYSEYSLTKSLLKINSLVFEVKNRLMPAIALTDENNLFAAVKFYKQSLLNNVKPIIGCDVIVKDESSFEKEYKLILICKNYFGYKILNKLLIKEYNLSKDKSVFVFYKSWFFINNGGLIAIFPVKDNFLTK